MKFNIDNLKNNTPEDVKKYFIAVYACSLTDNSVFKFKNNKELNNFLDSILNKYKHLSTERLWYALYLETILIANTNDNYNLMINSINRTLSQLDVIDLDMVINQIELIYTLLLINGKIILTERPFIAMRENDHFIFKTIVRVGEKLKSELANYEECFNLKKIISQIGMNETLEYLSKSEVIIEAWYTFAYTLLRDDVIPVIKNILEEDNDRITNDILNYLNLDEDDIENVAEIELEDFSIFDVYIPKEKINKTTLNFLKIIIKESKQVNLLLPIFNKYSKTLIDMYFNQ